MRKAIGRFGLWLLGWAAAPEVPKERKYVIIAAPHTSNWDFPVMLFISFVLGLRVYWMGKHTLFSWPQGMLFRRLGGVSVDRRSHHNLVDQVAAEIAKRDDMILLVPPEGTRKKTEFWKSGFYYIARTAGVPIVLGYLDFGRKVGGLGEVFWPTGDPDADIAHIAKFYHAGMARHPERFGPVRFKPRDAAAPPPTKS